MPIFVGTPKLLALNAPSSEQAIPTRIVNTDCWHYRYYCRIRKLWGIKTAPEKVTTICSYFHTCLWGTLALLGLLPFLLPTLWITKIATWLYRAFDRPLRWFDGWFFKDWCDNRFAIQPETSTSPALSALEDNFIVNGVCLALFYALVGIMAAAAIAVPFVGVAGVIIYSGAICEGIWLGILYLGWGIFKAAAGLISALIVVKAIGISILGCLGDVWGWICDVFTDKVLWLSIAEWAGRIVRAMLLGGIVGFSTVKVCKVTWNSKLSRLLRLLIRRMLGNSRIGTINLLKAIGESHKAAKAKLPWWTCDSCGKQNHPGFNPKFCSNCKGLNPNKAWYWHRFIRLIGNMFGAAGGHITEGFGRVVSADLHLRERSVKVLGPLAIVKDMFWALKHRACPRLEFASSAEIQRMVNELAQARNEDRRLAEEDPAAVLASGGNRNDVALVAADQMDKTLHAYGEISPEHADEVTQFLAATASKAKGSSSWTSPWYKPGLDWTSWLVIVLLGGIGAYLLRDYLAPVLFRLYGLLSGVQGLVQDVIDACTKIG